MRPPRPDSIAREASSPARLVRGLPLLLPCRKNQIQRRQVQARIHELPVEVRRLPTDENDDEQCQLPLLANNTRTTSPVAGLATRECLLSIYARKFII